MANIRPKSWLPLYTRSSSFWIVTTFLRIFKSCNRRIVFLRRLNIFLPAWQFTIWQGRLILSFTFFYLAIEWQNYGEISARIFLDHFLSSLWLSCAVSFRFLFNNVILEDSMIFLVANIQLYTGLLLYSFCCFYFITLRKKSRNLLPDLYNLDNKFENYNSPSILLDCLNSYNRDNLNIILIGWQNWAETLKRTLNMHPHLMFNKSSNNRRSWLAALNIVLDSSAALMVTSDGAAKRQARRTFCAARRALVEATDLLNLMLEQNAAAENRFHKKNNQSLCDNETDVLTSEFILEAEDCAFSTNESEMFDILQVSYQPLLGKLSGFLEANSHSQQNEELIY